MHTAPAKTSLLTSLLLAILLAPIALGFIIAACLSAGPSEVYKALTGRE